jgi:hypothetical protein
MGRLMRYLFILFLILISACGPSTECFDKNRAWEYFDYCALIKGTPQHSKSHPAECPWTEQNNKCIPQKELLK